ncbi:MAG: WG repeat-containing protein [Nanoarchaeota archaeon]|nr:WG repeat-containing protein [Nanoarchaeota archaeon]
MKKIHLSLVMLCITVISIQAQNPTVFSEKGNFGYINSIGDTIRPALYDFANSFKGGVAIVGIKQYGYNLYWFIDKKGNKLSSNAYFEITSFNAYGFAIAKKSKDGKLVLLDFFGKEKSKFSKRGYAVVKLGSCTWAIFNKKGELVLSSKGTYPEFWNKKYLD